jgi:hypothetical protein
MYWIWKDCNSMRRTRRGSSRVAAVWGGSGGRCGDRHEEQQFGFVAGAGSSTSGRRPPAFLRASCCNSCAPPAGERHGCAALVVPDGEAPGQPGVVPRLGRASPGLLLRGALQERRRVGAGSTWVHGVLAGGRSERRRRVKPTPTGWTCCGKEWGWSGGRWPVP